MSGNTIYGRKIVAIATDGRQLLLEWLEATNGRFNHAQHGRFELFEVSRDEPFASFTSLDAPVPADKIGVSGNDILLMPYAHEEALEDVVKIYQLKKGAQVQQDTLVEMANIPELRSATDTFACFGNEEGFMLWNAENVSALKTEDETPELRTLKRDASFCVMPQGIYHFEKTPDGYSISLVDMDQQKMKKLGGSR